MSIEDHDFDDVGLSAKVVEYGVVALHDEMIGYKFGITDRDAYALAKHFGLIDEWVSVHDKRPAYGVPVLLQINGIVQTITYNLDGGDDSLDWFEPYSELGVYDDLDNMVFFVTNDIDVKWKRLPK